MTHKTQRAFNRQHTNQNLGHAKVTQATPQGMHNLAAATSLHSFLFTLENSQALIEQLAAELAPMSDEGRTSRLDEWFDWADELLATREDLAIAQKAIDAYDASGTAGWSLGVASWEHSRKRAQTRLAEMASGPELNE